MKSEQPQIIPEQDQPQRPLFNLERASNEHVLLLDELIGDAIVRGERKYDLIAQTFQESLQATARNNPAEGRALLYGIGRSPNFQKHLGAAICLGLAIRSSMEGEEPASGSAETEQDQQWIDLEHMPITHISLLDELITHESRRDYEENNSTRFDPLETALSASLRALPVRNLDRAREVIHALARSEAEENRAGAAGCLATLILTEQEEQELERAQASIELLISLRDPDLGIVSDCAEGAIYKIFPHLRPCLQALIIADDPEYGPSAT